MRNQETLLIGVLAEAAHARLFFGGDRRLQHIQSDGQPVGDYHDVQMRVSGDSVREVSPACASTARYTRRALMTSLPAGSSGAASPQAATVLAGYRRQIRQRLALLVLLTVAIVVALIADVLTGPSDLGAAEVLGSLFGDGPMDETSLMIIKEVRLPGAVMALLVGMGLSLAGAELQTTLRNPLASPFTLGLSSAAILGAALAIVLGVRIPGVPDHWVISSNAFVFAFGSVLLLQAAVRRKGRPPNCWYCSAPPCFHVQCAGGHSAVHRRRAGVATARLLDDG